MATFSIDDIEAGKAVLWPPTHVEVRRATWGDLGEAHYEIEGDEHWDSEGDDNNFYARARDEWIARRMVAAWNLCIGVPTAELERAASATVDRLIDVAQREPRDRVFSAFVADGVLDVDGRTERR